MATRSFIFSIGFSFRRLASPMLFGAACTLAACDEGAPPTPPADLSMTMMNGPDMRAASDGAVADLSKPADLATPPDMTMPFTPIPGSKLGVNSAVSLTCDYDRRGWMVDSMGNCQRTFATNHPTGTKTIRIDAMGTGKYQITAGKSDAFASDYMLTTSETMTTAVYTDGGDPVATTRLAHTYELQPRALHVETDILHDNDTPLPPSGSMCATYYYEHTKCAGDITW